MNYLAHLFFADPSPQSIVGNLAADTVKGRIAADDPLREGITLHRQIDAFTDAHAAVGISRRRLEPAFRHTSRIIVDVFADHFLALDWSKYSKEPFGEFVDRIYGVVASHTDLFPAESRERFARMPSQDWLRGYAELHGIRMALTSLSRRLSRGARLELALDDLQRDYAGFKQDFDEYFPDVLQFVKARSARS